MLPSTSRTAPGWRVVDVPFNGTVTFVDPGAATGGAGSSMSNGSVNGVVTVPRMVPGPCLVL